MHARQPTSFLRGKRSSCRQSTTSFSENVVVAKTSYQMLEILSFSDRGRAQSPSTGIRRLTLVVKKSAMQLSGISILENRLESLKFNVALVVVLETKDP